ncbi:MAG: hypothetical protein WCC41_04470 [Rhodomicrobium sp.]
MIVTELKDTSTRSRGHARKVGSHQGFHEKSGKKDIERDVIERIPQLAASEFQRRKRIAEGSDEKEGRERRKNGDHERVSRLRIADQLAAPSYGNS